MPIEILAEGQIAGGLATSDRFGRTCLAWFGDREWRFAATGFLRRTCLATAKQDLYAVRVTAERCGFRGRSLRFPSGPELAFHQVGIRGDRYEFSLPDGERVLTARNTGGALRWNGKLRLEPAAAAIPERVPLLIPFAVFLVFNSWGLDI